MSREKPNCKGEGMIFSDIEEVSKAYQSKLIDMHAKIKVRMNITEHDGDQLIEKTKIVDTTTGRALISEILPKNIPYSFIDQDLNKKAISKLFEVAYRLAGLKETVLFADKIKNMGFKYSTLAGVSIGVDDMVIPKEKTTITAKAEKEVKDIEKQYNSGLLTAGERYNKVVDIWSHTNDQVSQAMMKQLGTEVTKTSDGKKVEHKSFLSLIHI